MKRQRRLPNIVLLERETILEEGGDGFSFKILSDFLCVLPDGRVWRVESDCVGKHKLEVGKECMGVDVGLVEDAMFDVTQADGFLDELVVLRYLVSVGEIVKVLDDGIATCADDAAEIVNKLTECSFETLATFAGTFATIELTAFGQS